MKIKGQLLCDVCGPDQRITLGRTKDEKIPLDGGAVLHFPSEPVTVSTVLRDIVAREGGFYRLSCRHLRAFPLFLLSAQEWILREDGTRLEGVGLPLAECLQ